MWSSNPTSSLNSGFQRFEFLIDFTTFWLFILRAASTFFQLDMLINLLVNWKPNYPSLVLTGRNIDPKAGRRVSSWGPGNFIRTYLVFENAFLLLRSAARDDICCWQWVVEHPGYPRSHSMFLLPTPQQQLNWILTMSQLAVS